MKPATRFEMFRRLRAANPHPTTELNYTSPFELLVAVVLSAQATDVGVNKAMVKLFPVANTPEAFAAQLRQDMERWSRVVKLSGAKID